ncbi:hypothetical protein [Bradyrhizobium diazoefficiens]|uniref:hypothetical protein n=1 Tax=Bradyrhizobium diazoefficiens TaxID=1355477 RepID=UPI003F73C1F4
MQRQIGAVHRAKRADGGQCGLPVAELRGGRRHRLRGIGERGHGLFDHAGAEADEPGEGGEHRTDDTQHDNHALQHGFGLSHQLAGGVG